MGNLLSLSIDHRGSQRVLARKPLPTVLELDEGDLLEGSVVDVSSRGLGLRLEVPKRLRTHSSDLADLQGELRVGKGDNPLLVQPCVVRHANVDIHPNMESHAMLGVCLTENQSPPIEKLTYKREDEEIDVLEGPEKLSEIVRDLVILGEHAIVNLKVGEGHYPGIYRHDTKLKAITSLKIELLNEDVIPSLSDRFEYTFYMEMYGSFHLFRTRIKKIQGKMIELAIPDRIIRITRRLTRRVCPKEEETFLATFTDPFTGETIAATIEDFTERGLAAIVDDEDFMLPTACKLEDIELTLGNHLDVNLKGTVVHCEARGEQGVYLGIAIANNSFETLFPLFNFVVSRRYPDITDIDEERFQQNWELFDKAGYLEEKNPDDFEIMRPKSLTTWDRLAKSKGQLARNFGITGNSYLKGGLHLTRLYSQTWIIHHLSILQGHQRHVTPQLFGGMCDYLVQADAQYVVSYTNSELSWNQKNYYNFVKEISSPADNVLKTFEVYEFTSVPEQRSRSSSKYPDETVRQANEYDLKRIAKHISGTLPKLQIEAFDLDRDTIEGDLFRHKYAEHSLLRDRKFFVFGSGQNIRAYAMCDIASDAVNIFSLLDKFEVFFVEDVAHKDDLLKALYSTAVSYYKNMGKEIVLYLGLPEDIKAVEALGGSRMASGNMWITSHKMIPRYKEYNARLFGRLMARAKKSTSPR